MIVTKKRALTIWVIYFNPSDYPGKYVVRAQHVTGPNPETDLDKEKQCTVHDSLAAARAAVPPGLYRLPRFAGDDRVIVETWF